MLDADAASYLERLRALGPTPGLEEGTPEAARASHEATAPALSGPGEGLEQVTDGELGGVPVRVFRPAGARGTTVYVHGGGWVAGSLDTYDPLCRSLALRSSSTVISVGYDLAPQARHPVQVGQVEAVLASVDGPVAIAGDSAGAYLSVLAASRTPQRLAAIALVYPVVAPALDTPSADAKATGYGLTTAAMHWYWQHYLGRGNGAGGPVSLLEADLAALPPALVLTAGHDPLRDEGLALADALERVGRTVRRVSYDGQVHGFFRMTAVIAQARQAQGEVAVFLRHFLG